ncbi:MAG: hypothetical protein IKM55_00205 [Bacilli bacterium]|nr:hypothetical protein [Bacilli bacterium]
MKKVLFVIICLVSFLSIVNAKTQIEYDWGSYTAPDYILGVGLLDNNIGVLAHYYDSGSLRYNSFTNDGEAIYNESYDFNGNAFILNNQIILFDYIDNACHQIIFTKDMQLIKEIEVPSCYFYDGSMIGETDKYYYINELVFDKNTNEFIDVENEIKKHELYNRYLSFIQTNDYKGIYTTLFEMLKDEYKGTYLSYFSFFKSIYSDDYQLVDYAQGADGSFGLVLFNSNNYKFEIDYYDSNYNLITKITSESFNIPRIIFRNGNFYLFEMIELDVESVDGYDLDFDVIMHEYNSLGKKIDQFSLVNIDEKSNYYGDYYNAREIFDIVETIDGFYLVMHKTLAPMAMDPVISDDQSISYYWPTVQKFNMTYSIETKETESGSISVDKDSSVTGELIRYNVKPREGYKLDKVIVTDDSGKIIEINDSSFIMPSSNVIVEAIFVVNNPNTGVFISIGASLLFIIAAVGIVVLNRTKVQKYE